MNWEAAGAIGEIIGALGVIATLAYLAIQIKQNTAATRTASFQATTDSLNQVNLLLASNRELAEVFELATTGLDKVDSVTLRQYKFILLAVYRAHESAYFQRNEGLLHQQSWQRYEISLRGSLHQEGTIEWWREQRFGFTEDFTAYVNQLIVQEGLADDA